jgi:hypothetical protein
VRAWITAFESGRVDVDPSPCRITLFPVTTTAGAAVQVFKKLLRDTFTASPAARCFSTESFICPHLKAVTLEIDNE